MKRRRKIVLPAPTPGQEINLFAKNIVDFKKAVRLDGNGNETTPITELPEYQLDPVNGTAFCPVTETPTPFLLDVEYEDSSDTSEQRLQEKIDLAKIIEEDSESSPTCKLVSQLLRQILEAEQSS